ncbi:MAG: hypothetical protein R3F19_15385 [Verrucomicrobiales bacterium]
MKQDGKEEASYYRRPKPQIGTTGSIYFQKPHYVGNPPRREEQQEKVNPYIDAEPASDEKASSA